MVGNSDHLFFRMDSIKDEDRSISKAGKWRMLTIHVSQHLNAVSYNYPASRRLYASLLVRLENVGGSVWTLKSYSRETPEKLCRPSSMLNWKLTRKITAPPRVESETLIAVCCERVGKICDESYPRLLLSQLRVKLGLRGSHSNSASSGHQIWRRPKITVGYKES